ncbi:lysine N(6)-hydroxylase/L-ornithine N(5)-oxygenase family protein [Halomonas ramblicola]|uniref:lysine N(6)-hydroxylase/L-ornithine N(5)-oxygenase family protein n=1 Tax=Halomonas ramblicola TaxID=747349 RepID=UPI0025B2FF87|nr:SidA/IucD/PvdA family monooxygenase [Halomonas ramblicola]MDN3522209.1 SidA/IucD/PvdA family monooxygenase [Halomonas ramblicola]
MQQTVHDFIAIGLGPFNLGLACLTDPIEELDGLFLERRDGFDWHPGLLLEDATLQTPFMADLVTMADPTSRFSVLNYLKQQGRLYNFYIREDFFLLRTEYNRYCQWAASQLDSIRFGTEVTRVDFDEAEGVYRVSCRDTASGETRVHLARRLVLGTGTRPFLPEGCRDVAPRPLHSSEYLDHKAELQRQAAITIVGSGQSAAEIYHDLLADIDRFGYRLDWITRSPRFFPLEYGKLTLEMTSPDYIDYFHALPEATRNQLMERQKGLYKGIDLELINAIYDLRYAKELGGGVHSELLTNTSLETCRYDAERGEYDLTLWHTEQRRHYRHRTPALIMATGYRYHMPDFLAPIASRLAFDGAGRYAVGRFYDIDGGRGELFVQNAELHTHSLVAPDLGMGPYRNACIIRALTGKEIYPVERRIAYQRFGAPSEAVFEPMDAEPA